MIESGNALRQPKEIVGEDGRSLNFLKTTRSETPYVVSYNLLRGYRARARRQPQAAVRPRPISVTAAGSGTNEVTSAQEVPMRNSSTTIWFGKRVLGRP